MLLYIIIICSVVPFIIWKIGDGRRARHKLLAGLVFDKFQGLKRFEKACLNAYEENSGDLSKEKFHEAEKNWHSSFRIEAGQYLQQKYSAAELSNFLSEMKDLSDEVSLNAIIPDYASHIDKVAKQNATNLVQRLRPNLKDDQQVMGRRRRRR